MEKQITSPSKNLSRNSIAFGFIALTCLYYCLASLEYIAYPLGFFDGSIQLVSASLIHRGLVPHVDFWHVYTSLNAYLHAFAFNLLGPSVISVRVVACVFYGLSLLALWIYFRKCTHLGKVTVAALVLGAAIFHRGVIIQMWWNAFFIGFLGLLVYMSSAQVRPQYKSAVIFGSGVCIAVTFLFKILFGAFFAFAIALSLLTSGAPSTHKQKLKSLLLFLTPILLGLTCYGLSFGVHFGEVFNQIIVYRYLVNSFTHLSANMDLNWFRGSSAITFPILWVGLRALYGSPHTTRFAKYFPICLSLILWIVVFTMGIQSLLEGSLPYLVSVVLVLFLLLHAFVLRLGREEFVVLVCMICFQTYYLNRADSPHYAPLMLLAFLLIPTALVQFQLQSKLRTFSARLISISIICVLFAVPTIPYPFWLPSQPIRWHDAWRLMQSKVYSLKEGDSDYLMNAELPLSGTAARIFQDPHELEILQYVYDRTTPQDYVYVGVKYHALPTLLQSIRNYWILGRKIPVKTYVMDPALTTQASAQDKMIRGIEENKVNWIVLWNNVAEALSSGVANMRGATNLDDYILKNFEIQKTLGPYAVFQRKSS